MSSTTAFTPADAIIEHRRSVAKKIAKEHDAVLDDAKTRLQSICAILNESQILLRKQDASFTSSPTLCTIQEMIQDLRVEAEKDIIHINHLKFARKQRQD